MPDTYARLVVRSSVLLSCWAALFIPGCSRSALTSEQTAALTAAEARWKQSGLGDYSFEIHPFAALSFGQNAGKIEVRAGAVKSVTQLGSLDPPSATIDELFAGIRQASQSGNYTEIAATYHPTLGYPTRIVYRARKEIADGNATVEITEFKDLTGR